MKFRFREYRGATIPNCPLQCFEKIIDQEISEHTVGGVEPKFMCGGGAIEGWRIRRYSIRLKRWSQHTQGSKVIPMNFCPVCASVLQFREVERQ